MKIPEMHLVAEPDQKVLIECDSCGPMGVSTGIANAMMTADRHLLAHGA